MKTFTVTVLSMVVVAILTVTLSANDKVREQKLQQAIDLIESKGDLASATPLLEDVAKSTDRALAARGLLHLAQAQERYGKGAALATYQRIVNDFGGAAETPATSAATDAARTKLAARTQKGAGLVARQIWGQSADAVSPDGRYMTFSDTGDLAVHDLSSGRDRVLTRGGAGNYSASESMPSPDSRLIAYSWRDSDQQPPQLRVIGRDGGEPRVVYANVEKARKISVFGWSPDGTSILATLEKGNGAARTRDLMLIPAGGGAARLIKHFDGVTARNFSVSPDGHSVGYDLPAAQDRPEADLFSFSLDTGLEVPMLKSAADDYFLGWFPEGGRVLFASDRGGTYGIWATRVVNGHAQGAPILIRQDTGHVQAQGFTQKGAFYYGFGGRRAEVYLAALDSTSGNQADRLARLEGRFTEGMMEAAWSPKGDRIAYVQATTPATTRSEPFLLNGPALNKKLAIHTISTGDVRLWPLGMNNVTNPAWLPDGRGVIVQGNIAGRQGLFLVNVETGAITTIAAQDSASSGIIRAYPAVSPDGRRVFFTRSLENSPRGTFGTGGIGVRDLASGAEQTVMTEASGSLALSPDGQWLAKTGPLRVVSSSGGDFKPLAGAVSGWTVYAPIAWSSDSRFVFVVRVVAAPAPGVEVWQIPVDGSAPRFTGIRWDGDGPNNIEHISAHPDGRRLAVSTELWYSATWVLQNIPPQREK